MTIVGSVNLQRLNLFTNIGNGGQGSTMTEQKSPINTREAQVLGVA
jgi:hypothetical protein